MSVSLDFGASDETCRGRASKSIPFPKHGSAYPTLVLFASAALLAATSFLNLLGVQPDKYYWIVHYGSLYATSNLCNVGSVRLRGLGLARTFLDVRNASESREHRE